MKFSILAFGAVLAPVVRGLPVGKAGKGGSGKGGSGKGGSGSGKGGSGKGGSGKGGETEESCLSDDARCSIYNQAKIKLNGQIQCGPWAESSQVCPTEEEASDPNFTPYNYCVSVVGEEYCLDQCEFFVSDCCACVDRTGCLEEDEQCNFYTKFYEDLQECGLEPDEVDEDACYAKYDGFPQLLCPCGDPDIRDFCGTRMDSGKGGSSKSSKGATFADDTTWQDEDDTWQDEDDGGSVRKRSRNLGGKSDSMMSMDTMSMNTCDLGCEAFAEGCCGLSFCFPKDAMIEVENKGHIRMEDLKLGDNVRSSTGFTKVYAFGTRNLNAKATFLKLNTASGASLELSENHFVFVGENAEPKLADEVETGDLVMLVPEKTPVEIVSIEEVEKEGPIHPLTYDGTIVVDGVLASVHAADERAPVIKVGGHTLINKHQFQQMLWAPLRVLCKLSAETFCSEDNHAKDDGSHHWIGIIEAFETFFAPEAVLESEEVDYEEANFFKFSAFLPMKILFVAWMLAFAALDAMWNVPFVAAAVVGLAVVRLAPNKIRFTVKANKKKLV